MILTSESIVLHSRRYSDTSRIVTIFTRDLGKVTVVAKGARSPKSPFGSSLEPLGHIRATFYHGRNRDLHTLSAAEVVTLRRSLPFTLGKLEAGLSLCDTIGRTQPTEQPDLRVFNVLKHSMDSLETCDEEMAFSIVLTSRLELANIMGFGLPGTQPPEEPTLRIDLTNGIARGPNNEGFVLSATVYEMLCNALRGAVFPVASHDRIEIEGFLSMYFSHHLNTRVPPKAPYISG